MGIQNSSGNSITTTYTKKNFSKKKRTSHRIFVMILLVIAIVLTSLFSPLFDLIDIKVEGIQKIPYQNIVDASGIQKGINIFRVDLSKSRADISKIPYVDTVNIKRILPNKIGITIVERKPVGSIPFMGSYILIDRKGNVLEVEAERTDKKLPVIHGLKFNEFKLGEMIKVDGENKLDIIVSLVKEFINHDLLDSIETIDVHEIDNIQLNIEDRLNVNIGDEFRMRYKMEFLVAILNEIGPNQKGFIDLSVEKPVFSLEK